jgi:hypothetical protein
MPVLDSAIRAHGCGFERFTLVPTAQDETMKPELDQITDINATEAIDTTNIQFEIDLDNL